VKRLAVLLAIVLLGLGGPAAASAQLGPQNVPEPLTAPDESETAQEAEEEDTGISTLQLVLIFGAAIGVVAFIAWYIMRDARGAAPGSERGRTPKAPETPAAAQKSARERERERARKRNKAKAARNQRKRNRPR